MTRAWAMLAGAVALALPRLVLACPYCAGQSASGSPTMRFVLLASMILLPFAVVGVVLRVVRKTDGAES